MVTPALVGGYDKPDVKFVLDDVYYEHSDIKKIQDKFKNSKEVLDELFLHREGIPIDEVDFDKKSDNQIDLFQNECEGMCNN